MCGIAGILGVDGPDAVARVGRMVRVMSYRGPDSAGVTRLPGAVFGHRRLSIIDLSDRGRQPMRSPDGRLSLVYNGEIYNYRELRAELARRWKFESDSDSEVLLAALAIWGESALDRLNGMFAFCLYDSRSREAFLARDRFGQKPLVYSFLGDALVFASEAKGILAAGVKARPDNAAWARYLADASYDDGERTFFEGISQLRPGECMRIRAGHQPEVRRWYDVAARATPMDIDPGAAAERLRDLLVDAVKLHMRADVPVGVSLSGGLDSSALLACLALGGELNDRLRTASVDFGGDLTERPWIEAAAAHHGLRTCILPYSPEAFRAAIEPMMWHLEGPIGGLMNCALAPVMRAFRDQGIVVVQDGTGLDEAFGGYRNHHDLHLGLALEAGGRAADEAVEGYARNWGVSLDAARAAGRAALCETVTAIDGTVPVRRELLDAGFVRRESRPLVVTPGTGDRLRDALARYLQTEKIPRNTRMKDRLSMAFSIELRLPFLDHRLVEFGLSLPPALLFRLGRTKSVVRDALAGAMDDDVRLAAKRSIQAPQGPWLMRAPMRELVESMLGSESFASRGMFDVPGCKAAFERFCTGADANSFFVWQWINVEQWFRTFVDRDAVASPTPLETPVVPADPQIEDAA
jgi:asparagine synthase (glutamine-hydrolysing)